MTKKSFHPRHYASGSALLIAVVLLLLAGVMTLLAMNVGIFEQRSTANDVRSKAVQDVAEAGLAQGTEYLLRQNPALLAFGGTWTSCGTETTFPCGSISTANVDADGDPTTVGNVTRRSTMYRLASGGIASGATFDELGSALASRMLPLTQTIASVGSGFTVAYGVAPVMCFVAKRAANETASTPIRCATSAAKASDRRIVTFVSVASIIGENARTTLTQTVGRYPLLANPMGKPPIIASGSVDVTGTLQIVTNPNAGGDGVPVSVWTRKDVKKTGTANTCYADEFFRYGAKNNSPPTFLGTNNTIVCDTCQCDSDHSLSYDNSGNPQDEGIDILDVEGDSDTARTDQDGTNYNVRSDEHSYPTCEFPPDLFAHLFGVDAWEDVDHDCFAEKKIMEKFTNPNTGVEEMIGADEVFLFENATKIINPTAAGIARRDSDQVYDDAYPSTDLSGLIWCQQDCDVGSNTTLGSPDHPVVLVIDGSARIQGKVFGLVFMRSTADGATVTASDGYTMTDDEIAAGGNATLDMNAGAAVYGSVVVQGAIDKANGTAAVIYSETVLNAIGESEDNNRYGTLPGAWNDRSTY